MSCAIPFPTVWLVEVCHWHFVIRCISGKWVYEIMLGSKGVMQVGWCTVACRFSQEVHRKLLQRGILKIVLYIQILKCKENKVP